MAPRDTGSADPSHRSKYESIVMIHLDAAYALARYLTRNDRDAEDIVQDACLRAFRFLETFRGGSSRAWFLTIVRNVYYGELKRKRSQPLNVVLDEGETTLEDSESAPWTRTEHDPIRALERAEAQRRVRAAVTQLPDEYREILVLRELEELSYQDIARIARIPIGTVMSRLSRARKLLYKALQQERES
jgi:RNA polymerase sigma-70 factor (ECF subfamily)